MAGITSTSFSFDPQAASTQALQPSSYPPFTSGTWTWAYEPTAHRVTLSCMDVSASVIAESVQLKTRIIGQSGSERQLNATTASGPFPPAQDWSASVAVAPANTWWSGKATLEVHHSAQVFVTGQEAARQACVAAQQSARLIARQHAPLLGGYLPNDVVFYFPRSNRELWANSAALRRASPLFADMFDSGFSESVGAPARGAFSSSDGRELGDGAVSLGLRTAALQVLTWACDHLASCAQYVGLAPLAFLLWAVGLAPSVPAQRRGARAKGCRPLHKDAPWQDSDDESDQIPSNLAVARAAGPLPAGVREVVVESAAYTTYHATLIWIMWGFIDFAPLSGTSLAATSTAAAQLLADGAGLATDPDLPVPASPKSVYALAHFLDLPELMKLALDDFKSKITINNVLHQLISDAALYEDIRDAVVAFARANWAAVQASPAAAELRSADGLEALGVDGEVMARAKELISML